MRKLALFGILLVVCACQNSESKPNEPLKIENRLTLDLKEANRLVKLPLQCIDNEFPNKLGQVIGSPEDLKSPKSLHPAFYGCFDWHSAVHGHWSLVKMVKSYPEMKSKDEIIAGLLRHISKENIAGEMTYFVGELNLSYERMYGWAWLLKLSEELHTWDHPQARELENNLKPLSLLIASRVKTFLPKLNYPIRVGTHTNTAFAMTMMYDYAVALDDNELKTVITERARDYFFTDADCPLTWEPSGYDFLSPCLEEADIMRRILSNEEFKKWVDAFLPDLRNKEFDLKPGIVSDRKDGHLVHLDGLNYSRAWCLYGIAETLPEYGHLVKIANDHIKHSLPSLTDGNYEGGHWLASFALLALSEKD
jgi:Protein of unknown function (DUF2891)